MTNSKAKIVWMYLLFWMLNSKPRGCLGFHFCFFFIKVRKASEFQRGWGKYVSKNPVKSLTRLKREKDQAKQRVKTQAIVAGQLLCSFWGSFWDKDCSDSQHLSPTPSILYKSTWNYQQYNNGSGLFHNIWQHEILWGCFSTLPYIGCPNLKWTEPLQQQWLLSVFISSVCQPCVSTFIWHQRHFLSHQGRELARPDPHHPSGHAWEHTAGGRCSSQCGRPEACSCVTIGEPARTRPTRPTSSVMDVVTQWSLEAEETSGCDTQLF